MTEMMSFPCPHCSTIHTVANDSAGREARCHHCQNLFHVPAPLLIDDSAPARLTTSPSSSARVQSAISPSSVVVKSKKSTTQVHIRSASGRVQVKSSTKNVHSSRSNRHHSNPLASRVGLFGTLALVLIAIVVGIAVWWPASKSSPRASPVQNAVIEVKGEQVENERLKSEMESHKSVPTKKEQLQGTELTASSSPLVVTSGKTAVVVTPTPTITEVTPEKNPEIPKEKASISDLVKKYSSSVVMVKTDVDSGMGFVAFEPDLMVTNYHVIKGSHSVQAICFDGEKTTAHLLAVLAVDASHDLALLQASEPMSAQVVEFVAGGGPSAGAEVFAIVDSDTGTADQTRSALNGVISDVEINIGKKNFPQMSVALNPVSSGAPLFDLGGKVIGVASVEDTQKGTIGFVVPSSAVKELYRGREGKYHVDGGFAKWESKQPFEYLAHHPGAISLSNCPSEMLYDTERDQLIGISPSSNKVIFIDLKSRKMTREIFTGTDPVALNFGAKGELWVANSTSKDLILIDLAMGKVTKTFVLQHEPKTFAVGRKNLWLLDNKGQAFTIKNNGKDEAELGMELSCFAIYGAGGSMLCSSAQSWLLEFDPDKTQEAMVRRRLIKNAIDDFRAGVGVTKNAKANAATRQALANDLASIEVVIAKVVKEYKQPTDNAANVLNQQPALFVDELRKRIYFNRGVMEMKDPGKIIGVFKDQEHSLRNNENLKEFFDKNPGFNQIRAISPDGKIAASGTHLYNTDDFSIITELPIPTSSVIFHPDNKTVYFGDLMNNQVIGFDYRKICENR